MLGKPFLQAVPILEQIENAGFEAYFVGGSVRDHILGREISDVDIATSALPEEVKEIFPKTTDVGIEHGTILVHYKGVPYEITTFRSETGYTDFRRPDKVSFIRSLTEDLQRRDFTMNAIAMDKAGKIIDPFGGQHAIQNKVIETVGNPDERFSEDALRMLRGVRFLAQLGFSIEAKTLVSLTEHAELLQNIAVERKTVEFEKVLQGKYRSKAVDLLVSTGIYQYLPGLSPYKHQLSEISEKLSINLDLNEAWVLMLHELGLTDKETDIFLRQWKLPVQKIKNLISIRRWLIYRESHKWDEVSVYHAGLETALSSERINMILNPADHRSLADIEVLYNGLPIKHRQELNITGNDLMDWFGRKPGPWLRQVIEDIELAVIKMELLNEKEKIREWLSGYNLK